MDSTATTAQKVPIFIDGEKFEVADDPTTATALLTLVSKSSADWYLVLKHGREQADYRGDDEIDPKSGDKFLTVFTGPTPVS
ncbi:MAG: hypothetical protein ACP5H2_10925 [Solirubrobacteraceae bacterium]